MGLKVGKLYTTKLCILKTGKFETIKLLKNRNSTLAINPKNNYSLSYLQMDVVYWAAHFSDSIEIVNSNRVFLVLEVSGCFNKILVDNKMGWIHFSESYNIMKVNQ